MTILRPADIARALPMDKAVEAMRTAFAAHAEGRVQAPSRAVLHTGAARGATLVMPAALESENLPLLAVKVVSVFPQNAEHGLASIHATVLASDPATGAPQALLDGASLTAIRTAAACGLATDLLARPESRVLAVFGSGVHARTQVRAICAVRSIEVVRIFNPHRDSATAMAEELSAQRGMPDEILPVRTSAEALHGADVACTATTSRVPVFEDPDLPEGIHLNAIGSFHAEDREIPGETVARSRVVVDDREAALEEAGDLLIPLGQGLIGHEHIYCDLGSLVLGRCEGRASERQITFFKSVGLAVQDLVAVQTVLREARRLGLGERIAW